MKESIESILDLSTITKDDYSAAYQKASMIVECSSDGRISDREGQIKDHLTSILKDEYGVRERI